MIRTIQCTAYIPLSIFKDASGYASVESNWCMGDFIRLPEGRGHRSIVYEDEFHVLAVF